MPSTSERRELSFCYEQTNRELLYYKHKPFNGERRTTDEQPAMCIGEYSTQTKLLAMVVRAYILIAEQHK